MEYTNCRLRCQSIIVKFLDRNYPHQEVRALQVPGCNELFISRDADFLTVLFVTNEWKKIKEINFNIKDIKEYAADGILWES